MLSLPGKVVKRHAPRVIPFDPLPKNIQIFLFLFWGTRLRIKDTSRQKHTENQNKVNKTRRFLFLTNHGKIIAVDIFPSQLV
jgi:hypothetical protein